VVARQHRVGRRQSEPGEIDKAHVVGIVGGSDDDVLPRDDRAGATALIASARSHEVAYRI
jgi:hypothetical protein